MSRCIITPTYSLHFPYIKKYLESFCFYLIDKEFPIYFIVNQKEQAELELIVKPYRDELNISIIPFETILLHFNILDSPDTILNKIGRISFQTIKKFYAALYLNCDQFLILDSESIMIKPTNINQEFSNYFENKEFFVSDYSRRPKEYFNRFTYGFASLASQITRYSNEFWPLESYNWFLELNILKSFVKQYGDLYEFVGKAELQNKYHDEGIEGELLYYPFILNNENKYGYRVFNTCNELLKKMGSENFNLFIERFNNSYRSHGGYLEGLTCFVDEKNYEELMQFFTEHIYPIIRISRKISDNESCIDFKYQKKLIENGNFKIIASSYTDYYYDYYVYEKIY